VRNHHEKTKDIAESALPSMQREWARSERRRIHARVRAQARAALRSCSGRDGREEVGVDAYSDPRRRISELKAERRTTDKLAPLTRWALRRVDRDPELRALSIDGQVAVFGRLLPGDSAGRHALDHVEAVLRLRDHVVGGDRSGGIQSLDDPSAQRIDEVRRILEYGLHGELNRRIRRQVNIEQGAYARAVSRGQTARAASRHLRTPRRLLLGDFDAEAFARDTLHVAGMGGIIANLISDPSSSLPPTVVAQHRDITAAEVPRAKLGSTCDVSNSAIRRPC
jgi:hypothetical protein